MSQGARRPPSESIAPPAPPSEVELTPADRVEDIPRITRALREAVQEALQRHKRDGHPVVVWRDGRVEWIQPEDIPGPPELTDGNRDVMTKSEVLEMARQLPPNEQLALIQDLWSELAPELEFGLTPELEELLDKRLAEARADPGGGTPSEAVHARLRRRLTRSRS